MVVGVYGGEGGYFHILFDWLSWLFGGVSDYEQEVQAEVVAEAHGVNTRLAIQRYTKGLTENVTSSDINKMYVNKKSFYGEESHYFIYPTLGKCDCAMLFRNMQSF